MFTTNTSSFELMGLEIAHGRELAQNTRHAQRIVDGKQSDIDLLVATVRKLQDELKIERAARMSAELKLERMEAFLASQPAD